MKLGVRSGSLSGQWVYYNESLAENPWRQMRELREKAIRSLGSIQKTSQLENVARQCQNVGLIEAEKERRVLSHIFGVEVNYNNDNPLQFYKDLTIALNESINLKEAFQRNLARIKAGEQTTTVAKVMGSYIASAINRRIQFIYDRITKMMSDDPKITFEQAANIVVGDVLEDAVVQGVEDAFNSRDFNKKDETNRSLSKLVEFLGDKGSKRNSQLFQQLSNIWQLDRVKEEMVAAISKPNGKLSPSAIRQSITNKGGKSKNEYKYGGAKGGLSGEAIMTYIADIVVNELNKNSNAKVTAFNTGEKGMRPDAILTFDIDPNIIAQGLEKDFGTREKALKSARALSDSLSKVNDGLIIYANAKDYMLNTIEKKGGFSGGNDMSLRQFKDLYKYTSRNIATLVGAIANTIPGSIGDEMPGGPNGYREYLSEIIATDIAVFLFDDISTIGKETRGATALHLFYLNGIYIPLSYILFGLSHAILEEKDKKAAKTFASVRIRTPEDIKYHKDSEEGDSGYDKWKAQKSEALDLTSISIHFMKNFTSFMNNLY